MVKSKGRPQKGVHSSSGVVHGWRELICRDGAHSGWRPKMLRTNYCDFLLEQLSLVSKAKSLCQNILCRCCRQKIKFKHPVGSDCHFTGRISGQLQHEKVKKN